MATDVVTELVEEIERLGFVRGGVLSKVVSLDSLMVLEAARYKGDRGRRRCSVSVTATTVIGYDFGETENRIMIREGRRTL